MNQLWRATKKPDKNYPDSWVLTTVNSDGIIPRSLQFLMYNDTPEWFEHEPKSLKLYSKDDIDEAVNKANALIQSYLNRGYTTINVEVTRYMERYNLNVQKLVYGTGHADENWVDVDLDLSFLSPDVSKAVRYALEDEDFDYINNNFLGDDLTLDLHRTINKTEVI